jgi:hypothetical protein
MIAEVNRRRVHRRRVAVVDLVGGVERAEQDLTFEPPARCDLLGGHV